MRSRQQRLSETMVKLKEANAKMREVADSPGLAAFAEGFGRTSRPSPVPQPGVRQTELLTGAKRAHELSAWSSAVARQHLCFPPERYPESCGPLSRWTCACGGEWEAHGIAVYQYSQSPSFTKRDVVLGPEFWRWVEGTGTDTPERYLAQEPYWDWRPSVDKIAELLQRRWGRV